jgi:hypothetical protein
MSSRHRNDSDDDNEDEEDDDEDESGGMAARQNFMAAMKANISMSSFLSLFPFP